MHGAVTDVAAAKLDAGRARLNGRGDGCLSVVRLRSSPPAIDECPRLAELDCGRPAGFPRRLDLTSSEQKVNIVYGRPRPPRPLSLVVVRIGCRQCSRKGAYRLARLAAKFGPEITLRDLTNRFSYDCMWRPEARSKKGKSACGVYLPDLEHKRPPDLPPGMVKLRLVRGD